ncbi:copper chaperone CopZ [Aneurinibacillus sp. Ricciae_BoGa-3]|uniref:copper chaperone CopZ n=1 Tax=Aneurinibacillus sp. Ricciae_BoGa-3 TaxID=3022697 RepID=UPI002340B41B|nr:copper chaperone CopZ [Aneurinibacillus sp. Ricciae_BoGa-3]WCK54845.1 copper chaperone CopZ [Aneurinibacillus sp. Ricciae_BoGa-3]
MENITLNVKGMTCGHCEKAVRTALEELNGISKVSVHLKEGKVDVAFDNAKVSTGQMKEAIEEQGYNVV